MKIGVGVPAKWDSARTMEGRVEVEWEEIQEVGMEKEKNECF